MDILKNSNEKFLSRLKLNFVKSTGSVAINFAIMSTLLVAMFSGTIELTRMNSAKASLQSLADGTALTAKKAEMENATLTDSAKQIKVLEAANNYFNGVKVESEQSVEQINLNLTQDTEGAYQADVTGRLKIIMGDAIGFNNVEIKATGVSVAGLAKSLEVALVLDNTASMFSLDSRSTTRFTELRRASKNFVSEIFKASSENSHTRVAIIPWTTTVNIKSEVPLGFDNSNPTNLNIADYGSRILPQTTISRADNLIQTESDLQTMYAPVGWRGCISGDREDQAQNDNTQPQMKWNALLVPPNTPSTTRTLRTMVNGTCQSCTGCSSGGGGGGGTTTGMQGSITPNKNSHSFANFTGIKTNNVACSCSNYACSYYSCPAGQPNKTKLNCNPTAENGRRNAFFNFIGSQECVVGGCRADINSSTALGCVSDPNEIAWNNSGGKRCTTVAASNWTKFDPIVGPNLNCPMPMLGLSGSPKQVFDTIDRMSPAPGGTHTDVGLRWGLRVLSPKTEWANFFGQTSPLNYDDPNVSKVMILITDGANSEAIDFPGYWGCSRNTMPGCTAAPSKSTLDQRMLQWCDAIRNDYNITLYTVAINTNDAQALSLLTQCAGAADRAFSGDANDLQNTLAKIAAQTYTLRISK